MARLAWIRRRYGHEPRAQCAHATPRRAPRPGLHRINRRARHRGARVEGVASAGSERARRQPHRTRAPDPGRRFGDRVRQFDTESTSDSSTPRGHDTPRTCTAKVAVPRQSAGAGRHAAARSTAGILGSRRAHRFDREGRRPRGTRFRRPPSVFPSAVCRPPSAVPCRRTPRRPRCCRHG